MSANGQLPDSQLATIPGGRLRKDAAAAWNALCAEAARRGLPVPRPGGPDSSYRTLNRQRFWKAWWTSRGRPGNAATPSTSNHGWGLAVDCPVYAQQRTIELIGAAYGWQKRWSDASWEPWHYRWRAGSYPAVKRTAAALPALRLGSRGSRVRGLQRRLRALGFASVPVRGPKHGYFGASTVSAVKRFQRRHKLKADGLVGKSTTAALKRAVR